MEFKIDENLPIEVAGIESASRSVLDNVPCLEPVQEQRRDLSEIQPERVSVRFRWRNTNRTLTRSG